MRLGIRQILARSPQARGRSERAFGTLQGRLPQELRLHHITDYQRANRYLEEVFVPDFNRRFTVRPAQQESAFVKLAGIELELVLSSKHERIVRNDNTVAFQGMVLQLPASSYRAHFVRCAVTVHQFPNAHARHQLPGPPARALRQRGPAPWSSTRIRSAPQLRSAGPAKACRPARRHRSCRRGFRISIFPPALQMRVGARTKKCF